ncbi:hypothetical protein Acr_15g0019260 [Actinidia rufa]|uniref:Ankyrin repeat family protein n=1 Tax=Actinidia rufa TaxID=165716 RepID=A0A7J0FZF9_9ERIC|nr:hypothetical protein Acr_15g0019260 [Actinidia rufa]
MALSISDEKLNSKLYEAVIEGKDDKVVELCKETPEGPLHVVTTSNKAIRVAEEMLRKASKLLSMRNEYGETALFCAARYGKKKMFEFLDAEVYRVFPGEGQEEEERKAFYEKNDKTTILHATILTGHFGVRIEDISETEEGESCYRVPLWEEDTESAIDQSKSKMHKYGVPSFTSMAKRLGKRKTLRPLKLHCCWPLRNAFWRSLRKILTVYPQAVEHIDDQGHNILHIAIKYRQIRILDFVEKLTIPMTRLIRKIDNNGNTIYCVWLGIKEDNHDHNDMRSPALLLREHLLLFEVALV